MGVVARVEGVGGGAAEGLVGVGDGLEVVEEGEGRGVAEVVDGNGGVPDEAWRAGHEDARLPEVVGRLAADDDTGPLGRVRARRALHVVVEGVDGLARFAGDARLVAGAGAVAAPVLAGAVGRPAVVVPELDHHDVPGLDQALDLREAALVAVAARRPAPDRLVHHRDRHVLSDVLTPA